MDFDGLSSEVNPQISGSCEMLGDGKQSVSRRSGRKVELAVRFRDPDSVQRPPRETTVNRVVIARESGFAENFAVKDEPVFSSDMPPQTSGKLYGTKCAKRVAKHGKHCRSMVALEGCTAYASEVIVIAKVAFDPRRSRHVLLDFFNGQFEQRLAEVGRKVTPRTVATAFKGSQQDCVFAALAASQAARRMQPFYPFGDLRSGVLQHLDRSAGVLILRGTAQIYPSFDRGREPVKNLFRQSAFTKRPLHAIENFPFAQQGNNIQAGGRVDHLAWTPRRGAIQAIVWVRRIPPLYAGRGGQFAQNSGVLREFLSPVWDSKHLMKAIALRQLTRRNRMKIMETTEIAPTCHSSIKLVETAEVAPTCHNNVKLVESTEVAPTCH